MLAPTKTPMQDPGIDSGSVTSLIFAWAPTSIGLGVSFASIQGWFNDWNPILQGIVFIVTILSLIIGLFMSKKNK